MLFSRSGANSVEVFHVTPIPYSCEANYSVDGSTVVLADVNNLALMGAARACLQVLCRPGGVDCASVRLGCRRGAEVVVKKARSIERVIPVLKVVIPPYPVMCVRAWYQRRCEPPTTACTCSRRCLGLGMC